MKKRSLVVLAEGLLNWSGGVDFFLMNVLALHSCADDRELGITLLFPQGKFVSKLLRPFLKIPLLGSFIKRAVIRKNELLFLIRKAHHKARLEFARSGEKRVVKSLQKWGAELVLFARGEYALPCPTVGYIPDLQHRHLPEFFSEEERQKRERNFGQQLILRDRVIVSSFDVKADLERVYGPSPKLTCLPYLPFLLDDSWVDSLPYDVKEKYGISFPYFMICNQFWIHKDHKTAFRALKMMADRGIHLVCTGKQEDYRFPTFYKELLAFIEELGLGKRVHILGFIPKREQIELMKHSLALIQPTLFEGGSGGGATQSALALGKRVICSDIASNLEIKHPLISFFKTKDQQDLCSKMESLLQEPKLQLSKEELMKRSNENKRTYGRRLLAVIGGQN